MGAQVDQRYSVLVCSGHFKPFCGELGWLCFRQDIGGLPDIVAKRGVPVVYGCVQLPEACRVYNIRLNCMTCRCGFCRVQPYVRMSGYCQSTVCCRLCFAVDRPILWVDDYGAPLCFLGG